jgi:lipopolysaccharide export system protein LptC
MKSLERQAEGGAVSAPPGRPRDALQWRPKGAADRYTRFVVLLKRALPAFGATLLLLVAAWPRLSPLLDSVRLGFAAIDLREARELKMLNPHYAGTDRLNRPYVVTAAVGRQVPNHDNLMSLEKPRGEMTVHSGAKVVVTAATGIYQSQTQLLDLFGDVTMTHQNGTRFVTTSAHADFSDNTAEGHDPIEGHGPSGDIWGQGFRVVDKGDTIIFTGRSHAILKGSKPGTGKAAPPPPALPATVAKTAALIEASGTLQTGTRAKRHAAASSRPDPPKKRTAHPGAGRPHPAKRAAVHSGEDQPVPPRVEGDAG